MRRDARRLQSPTLREINQINDFPLTVFVCMCNKASINPDHHCHQLLRVLERACDRKTSICSIIICCMMITFPAHPPNPCITHKYSARSYTFCCFVSFRTDANNTQPSHPSFHRSRKRLLPSLPLHTPINEPWKRGCPTSNRCAFRARNSAFMRLAAHTKTLRSLWQRPCNNIPPCA